MISLIVEKYYRNGDIWNKKHIWAKLILDKLLNTFLIVKRARKEKYLNLEQKSKRQSYCCINYPIAFFFTVKYSI